MCPTFECPKCYNDFIADEPLDAHDMVAMCEEMLKILYKSKAPQDQVQAFKGHIAALKLANQNLDEEHAEIYKQHADIAELVRLNIAELSVYKQQVLDNQNPGFLN